MKAAQGAGARPQRQMLAESRSSRLRHELGERQGRAWAARRWGVLEEQCRRGGRAQAERNNAKLPLEEKDWGESLLARKVHREYIPKPETVTVQHTYTSDVIGANFWGEKTYCVGICCWE